MKAKILIILILSVVLSSCDDGKVIRCDLTEAQKQIIPSYEKGKISFIDGAGQTVYLTIENHLYWHSISKNHDEYYYKLKAVTLKSRPDDLVIGLNLIADGGLSEDKYKVSSGYVNSSFLVNINTYAHSTRIASFGLTVDTEGNFLINSSMAFHDSLEINGKVYFDVVEKNEGSMQLFYSKTYGILQFRKEGANFLTLKD